MTTVANPFQHLNNHTTKGAALTTLGQGVVAGKRAITVLTFTGAAVDRETLTIDGDVYEVVDISTDSTFDIGATDWDNTDATVVQSHTSHSFSVGDYVCVESEIAKVSIVDGDQVTFDRSGYGNTTVAAHSTGTTAIEVQEGTALTAGAITVPVADVTAALTLSSLDDIVTRYSTKSWELVKISDTVGLIRSAVMGARAAVCAETFTNASVVTPTYGGADHAVSPCYIEMRVPTSDEVTAGDMYFNVPFTPAHAIAYVHTTADWSLDAWDGAYAYDRTNDVVTIDNSGTVDWAATDTVVLLVYGDPVACPSATIID